MTSNPWFEVGYGGDTPDWSDQISGLDDRNRPQPYKQPCVKISGQKMSLNPEEGADTGLSASLPDADGEVGENNAQPDMNGNTPVAWTGSSERVFNPLNIGDPATVADAGNTNQEVFDTQAKRDVQRHQQQRARRMLD